MKPETLHTFHKRPIVIIALLTAVCLVGDSMLYVVLPTHLEEAGLTSLWQVGILLSINRLIRLPLNPLIGWLYTKISARTGVLIAVILAFFNNTLLRLDSWFDCAFDCTVFLGNCLGIFAFRSLFYDFRICNRYNQRQKYGALQWIISPWKFSGNVGRRFFSRYLRLDVHIDYF